MNYSELHLNENLYNGLKSAGYEKCTPVQEKVLEISLEGVDLYVQSQTGTGKTAAFLVTIMEQLLKAHGNTKNSALILLPTRELAVQVEKEAKKLGKFTELRTAAFFGGVPYEKQFSELEKGVDILIGTPGRIIDLVKSRKLDLSGVHYLAIDEADRMFDMGFYPDLRKILKFLPAKENRQTMLFSATLNSYVKNLAWEYTKNAKEIVIQSESITVEEIEQELIHVSSDEKLPLLLGIIAKENPESLIIFCNTKKMCEILSKRLLINGFQNEFIIGDLPQKKRLKIMNDFKSGNVKCLIATDVAARGIDVQNLQLVVNYDIPLEAENYVHRIGRTARAGKTGKAYTLCSEQDVYSLMPIERYIGKSIPSRVAEQSDFAEDKSKNVFIRLDSDRKNFREEKSKTRRTGSVPKKSAGDKSSARRKNPQSAGAKRKERSDSELEKLSAMSSDERMNYYKEKYAKKSAGAKSNFRGKQNAGKKADKAKIPAVSEKNRPEKSGFFAKMKKLFGGNK